MRISSGDGEKCTLSQLVISAWGWSLVAFFFCVTLMMGIYWYHPFYDDPGREMTTLQENIPLLIAGVVWCGLVAMIIMITIRRGRAYEMASDDVSHLWAADWIISAIAFIFALGLPGAIGAGIATMVNSFLLILCLIHLSVTVGVKRCVEKVALLSTVLVAFSIALCWIVG